MPEIFLKLQTANALLLLAVFTVKLCGVTGRTVRSQKKVWKFSRFLTLRCWVTVYTLGASQHALHLCCQNSVLSALPPSWLQTPCLLIRSLAALVLSNQFFWMRVFTKSGKATCTKNTSGIWHRSGNLVHVSTYYLHSLRTVLCCRSYRPKL